LNVRSFLILVAIYVFVISVLIFIIAFALALTVAIVSGADHAFETDFVDYVFRCIMLCIRVHNHK